MRHKCNRFGILEMLLKATIFAGRRWFILATALILLTIYCTAIGANDGYNIISKLTLNDHFFMFVHFSYGSSYFLVAINGRIDALHMNGTSRTIIEDNNVIERIDYHYRWIMRWYQELLVNVYITAVYCIGLKIRYKIIIELCYPWWYIKEHNIILHVHVLCCVTACISDKWPCGM